MPFHWPGSGRANPLTNPALDPTPRMPEFKVCAVRVEVPSCRVVIVGNGMAGGRLAEELVAGDPGATSRS